MEETLISFETAKLAHSKAFYIPHSSIFNYESEQIDENYIKILRKY